MDLSVRTIQGRRQWLRWATLRAIVVWPARVVAARRAMLQLTEMSAHELKDIGLFPQDLIDATALSLHVDPTDDLARRVRERRRMR